MKIVYFLCIVLLVYGSVFFYSLYKEKTKPVPKVSGKEIRYVPIGDSYTIGEGVSAAQSYPQLLTDHLQKSGYNVNLVITPAQSGWTTQDAIDGELVAFINAKPDFATLLIGANDIAQGVDDGRFRDRLIYLIDHMLGAIPDRNSLILITIPDFSVTKVGGEFGDHAVLSAAIDRFNKIIKEEGKKRRLPVVDITELSRQMGTDESLINPDNLHPSAKEYALWEQELYKATIPLLHR